MEYQSEFTKNLRDPQSSRRTEKAISTQASQSLKLQDRFKLERPSLSYADFHHEIIKNADDLPPKFSGNHQKLRIVKMAAEDDELVKYMSNLPSYLARGENVQEKALNVGVLDWGRLEKWQHNLKQIPCRSSVYSPSSSKTSSFFSNDGSFTHSSSGHSCSPSHQKMHQLTLQSHLTTSSQESFSQCTKPLEENSVKFQDLKVSQTDPLNRQQKMSKMDKPSNKNQSVAMLDRSMKRDSDVKITAKIGSSSHLENYEAGSCSNGSVKTLNGKFAKKAESEKLNTDIIDRDCPERQNRVVLLLPRDISQTISSAITQHCGSMAITGQNSTEATQRSSTYRSSSTEVHSQEFHSNIPHSGPLPCEVENNELSQNRQQSSMDSQCIGSSFISPSRSRKIKEKSTRLPIDSTVIKSPQESDQKTSKVAAAKVRNSSPTRLFSLGLSRISRSLNSKEDPDDVLKLTSTHVTAKLDKERNVTSGCSDNSGCGKHNATNKARSSPLRRLLDPLLKPKAADSRRSSEPLQKGPISSERACKSSDGQLESSDVHFGKVKVDLTSCKYINVKDSYQRKNDGSPTTTTVQALLQVAIKNGLPLFTFAVDNNSGILAATVRDLSSPTMDDYSCLYTFFTIREIKKKSWINQGGKGRDYIPNVVAQMKVSDDQFSNLTRRNSKDNFTMREFVLFSVDVRHEDRQSSDFQPKDELAAIVVKIPNEPSTSLFQDGQQSDNYCKLSELAPRECLPEERCYSNSGTNMHNQTFVGSKDHRSTTVILPSGVHSLSSKGEPSSLVERWKSGGVCDCGGWDLGCKLRVLGDRNQLNKKLSSSTTCSTTDQFELFDQEGVQESHVFRLAPFKDGIYSVAFNSSLSHLQAFSICMAALDSRKISGVSDPSDSLQGKTSDENISMDNDGIKAPNGIQEQIPVRHVSYPPPLSPVGRV